MSLSDLAVLLFQIVFMQMCILLYYWANKMMMMIIRVLRCRGMNDQALQAVYRSVVIAKLLRTRPAPDGALRRQTIVTASKPLSVEELGLDCIRWMGQRQRSSWSIRPNVVFNRH